MTRCHWAESSELMIAYHDTEWGSPAHDDQYLFEMLLLEGAQAGLSWSTVLNKRENYRQALDGFQFEKISDYSDDKLGELLLNPGIIRNRLKVAATVKNARAFIAVREEWLSFDAYIWNWVDCEPIVNRPSGSAALVASNELSDQISKDLKRRGFTFVGSTIMYSYLQAIGVVNDHLSTCDTFGQASDRRR